MVSISVSLLVVGAFALAVAFIISRITYKDRFNHPYDIRNHFPYEINYESNFKDNLLGNVCFIISSICLASFYATFDTDKINGFYIAAFICGVLNTIALLLMLFLPLKMLKHHLLIVAITISLSFLSPFFIALNGVMSYNYYPSGMKLVPSIIAAIDCLFMVILFVNPRLNKWANLEKKENEDGSISYIRPKIFVLAFTEWLLLFNNLLIPIILIISKSIIN